MSSFFYPRVVTIKRKSKSNKPGVQPYSGATQAALKTILTKLPAHIESERQGTTPTAKLPDDTAGQSIWSISFRARDVKPNAIQSRDTIEDDLGKRYYVISVDPSPLVVVCRCQILET